MIATAFIRNCFGSVTLYEGSMNHISLKSHPLRTGYIWSIPDLISHMCWGD